MQIPSKQGLRGAEHLRIATGFQDKSNGLAAASPLKKWTGCTESTLKVDWLHRVHLKVDWEQFPGYFIDSRVIQQAVNSPLVSFFWKKN